MRDLRRRLGTLLSTAYRADPARFVAYVAYISVWQASPLVGAVLVRSLIDGVLHGHDTQVQLAAVLLGVVAAGGFAAARARSRTIHVLIEKCTEAYDRKIMDLSAGVVDIGHLEQPEFLDKLEQLRFQPYVLGLNGPQSSVIIWGAIQAVLVIGVLLSVSPVLMLLPVVSVPSLWAVRRAERLRQEAFELTSGRRRQANHFFDVATNPARADEVRTLRIRHELLHRHNREWVGADRAMTAAELRAAAVALAGRLVFAAGYLGAIIFVVEQGIRRQATVGQVVLTVVLAGLINQQVVVILDSVGRVLNALVMVDRYLWLVDYACTRNPPPGLAAAPSRLRHGVTLSGVSFRYPETEAVVLDDLNVDLPAGKVIAVVGDNGAGKTTLVKLLTAMYQPTAGAITVDGVDLAAIDPVSWRQATTAAFQDFARFELLLGESVGTGQLSALHDHDAVRTAMRRGGADTLEAELPGGLDTPLGSSFDDGVQLSGGQWQKVALSRAMMRPTPLLVVLDEPTASLDPLAERELFTRYSTHARRPATTAAGSITLLVSHRFSTVRSADLIVVLSDHGIAEVGTHDDLVSRGGLYAELYQLQAARYL